jgi:hypothetical protein
MGKWVTHFHASVMRAIDSAGFPAKNRILVYFRFNTPIIFPETGSRKRFHASVMCAIDSLHQTIPIVTLLKKSDPKIKKELFDQPNISKMDMFQPIVTHL